MASSRNRMRQNEYGRSKCVHFFNRAVMGEVLFRDAQDKQLFIDLIFGLQFIFNFTVIAYCLMPDHFHIILRQNGDQPLYKVFHSALSSYVRIYNRRHKRYGRLFASKLKSKLVVRDGYMYNLVLYIHANPVKAGLVDRVEDWEWSDYPDWCGDGEPAGFDREIRDTLYGSGAEYRASMAAYLAAMN